MDNDSDVEDIRNAFKGDTDIKRALTAYLTTTKTTQKTKKKILKKRIPMKTTGKTNGQLYTARFLL
jgi:hypothetical protein